MRTLGLRDAMLESLYGLLAALIHLGECEFTVVLRGAGGLVFISPGGTRGQRETPRSYSPAIKPKEMSAFPKSHRERPANWS